MHYKDFALLVKLKRINKGLLQQDMAKLIPTQLIRYHRIENGTLEPTFIELQEICRILGIDLTELLELKKPIHGVKYYD